MVTSGEEDVLHKEELHSFVLPSDARKQVLQGSWAAFCFSTAASAVIKNTFSMHSTAQQSQIIGKVIQRNDS